MLTAPTATLRRFVVGLRNPDGGEPMKVRAIPIPSLFRLPLVWELTRRPAGRRIAELLRTFQSTAVSKELALWVWAEPSGGLWCRQYLSCEVFTFPKW